MTRAPRPRQEGLEDIKSLLSVIICEADLLEAHARHDRNLSLQRDIILDCAQRIDRAATLLMGHTRTWWDMENTWKQERIAALCGEGRGG